MYRLENWAWDGVSLYGNVYDNPKFENEKYVRTSPVMKVVQVGDNVVAQTKSGSEYMLGVVHGEYEAQYPGAKQRLLDTPWNKE